MNRQCYPRWHSKSHGSCTLTNLGLPLPLHCSPSTRPIPGAQGRHLGNNPKLASCDRSALFSITSKMLLPQRFSFQAFALLPRGGTTNWNPPLFRLCFRVDARHFLSRYGAQFAADDVGREAGAEEAAVEGGELAVINF